MEVLPNQDPIRGALWESRPQWSAEACRTCGVVTHSEVPVVVEESRGQLGQDENAWAALRPLVHGAPMTWISYLQSSNGMQRMDKQMCSVLACDNLNLDGKDGPKEDSNKTPS